MLFATVSLNSSVSCVTMPKRPRSSRSRTSRMSTPSIVIRPLVGIVEPRQQLDERRLAAAVRADDGDRLAGSHFEVDAVQHLLVGMVVEVDVLERDALVSAGSGCGLGGSVIVGCMSSTS